MKKSACAVLLFLFIICVTVEASAGLTTITNGQIFIGGSSFKTPGYQTYIAFNLTGRRQNPRIEYVFFGEQVFSVYQDHPIQPKGFYRFSFKMPYSPDGILIDNEVRQPVWYSECRWDVESNIVTPIADDKSPQFINVQAPFSLSGRMYIYGAASISTRVRGFGTVDIKFELIGGRYHLLEARYVFGDQNKKN